jgi:uncharacterized protein DUF922
MAITALANPARLEWRHFRDVSVLPGSEWAHVDPHFDIPNRPLRQVDGQFMLAETFQVTVTPIARARRGITRTPTLLAHEQGHYDLVLLAARAMARDLQTLRAPNRAALQTALQQCYTLHATRLGPIQEQYDSDTEHGVVVAQQQRWQLMIRACLDDRLCSEVDRKPV